MPRPKYRKTPELPSFENETMDENAMFIQHHLWGYLDTIAKIAGAVDKDFIKFAIKVLGANIKAISEEFSALLEPENRNRFEKYLEGADDADDVAMCFIKIMAKSDKKVFKVFSWLNGSVYKLEGRSRVIGAFILWMAAGG